jgi:hypothetical protein
MVKQQSQRQLLALRADNLCDAELQEVLDFITLLESKRRNLGAVPSREDELVALLADAPENRRARQAHEWEVVRRRAERRASVHLGSA